MWSEPVGLGAKRTRTTSVSLHEYGPGRTPGPQIASSRRARLGGDEQRLLAQRGRARDVLVEVHARADARALVVLAVPRHLVLARGNEAVDQRADHAAAHVIEAQRRVRRGARARGHAVRD